MKPVVRWSVMWHSRNLLDGLTEHLMSDKGRIPVLFPTRREAREWIAHEYGYIAKRPDLRAEPHGWRVPRPVRVTITANNDLSGRR